jgi:hypothetical protein
MNTGSIPRALFLALSCMIVSAAQSTAGPFSLISQSEKMTAVSSKIHNGYARTRFADGSFKPETYGFAIGGYLNLSPRLEFSIAAATSDPTIDRLTFGEISRIIEQPLAAQQYVATANPENADLLIVVYWGRTIGTEAFNGAGTRYGPDQDKINLQNARLLGFANEPVFEEESAGPALNSNILKEAHYDVLTAVRNDRYYVILMAFDFQALWKEKKTTLLWETRFSLSERRHDFGEELPKMAQFASQFFGQDSYGVILKPIPEGRVGVGEAKSLGEIQPK